MGMLNLVMKIGVKQRRTSDTIYFVHYPLLVQGVTSDNSVQKRHKEFSNDQMNDLMKTLIYGWLGFFYCHRLGFLPSISLKNRPSRNEWGWVMGALENGISPREVVTRLKDRAMNRRGKRDATRYARLTVQKACQKLGIGESC
jgi:hypothetical protein